MSLNYLQILYIIHVAFHTFLLLDPLHRISTTHCNPRGTTYIRWGRTVCPNITGTDFVYDGLAAGSHYNNRGGGANYICVANGDDAEYHTEATTVNLDLSVLRGTEYQMQNGQALDHLFDYFVPCAICEVSSRSKLLMIPGRYTCPDTWTVEYSGWLVAEMNGQHRVMYICLDKTPETKGIGVSTNGAQMHHVQAACSTGLPCPNYDGTRELACVVCTK